MMHRLLGALVASIAMIACGGKTRCYDCGGPMTVPALGECRSDMPTLACADGAQDGCETRITDKHACVPAQPVTGGECGGASLTCADGLVDACDDNLGRQHVCVVRPAWLDTSPQTAPDAAPQPPGETALVYDGSVDTLLDIDQPREQKPGGDWTQQVYVGAKKYDRLFVVLTLATPAELLDPPKGPLGAVDHVDLYTGTDATPLVTIKRSDKAAFTYTAETTDDFAYDRGSVIETHETMKLFLGAKVGDYVKSAHPFTVVLRARSADGKLVYEHTFGGDEADEYMAITPPRPY
jgi:hypothetical protein